MVPCLSRPYALSFLLIALVGCGGRGGPEVVQVTGTLTHKGKPVPNALLNFLPEFGRQSWAETDDQGRFKIFYDRHQDGAVVGKHKVWIQYKQNPKTALEPGEAVAPRDMRALFDRYNYENSKLTVQIDRNTTDIKLELE